jgi:hypothetical protein
VLAVVFLLCVFVYYLWSLCCPNTCTASSKEKQGDIGSCGVYSSVLLFGAAFIRIVAFILFIIVAGETIFAILYLYALYYDDCLGSLYGLIPVCTRIEFCSVSYVLFQLIHEY